MISQAYSPLLFWSDAYPMPTLRSSIGLFMKGLWLSFVELKI